MCRKWIGIFAIFVVVQTGFGQTPPFDLPHPLASDSLVVEEKQPVESVAVEPSFAVDAAAETTNDEFASESLDQLLDEARPVESTSTSIFSAVQGGSLKEIDPLWFLSVPIVIGLGFLVSQLRRKKPLPHRQRKSSAAIDRPKGRSIESLERAEDRRESSQKGTLALVARERQISERLQQELEEVRRELKSEKKKVRELEKHSSVEADAVASVPR